MNNDYFKNVWNAGKSQSQMAVMFNCSRGKIRRLSIKLGLPCRIKAKPDNTKWHPVVNSHDIPDRHHCHFPIGDPKHKGFGYCGLPVYKKSYCKECFNVVYKGVK